MTMTNADWIAKLDPPLHSLLTTAGVSEDVMATLAAKKVVTALLFSHLADDTKGFRNFVKLVLKLDVEDDPEHFVAISGLVGAFEAARAKSDKLVAHNAERQHRVAAAAVVDDRLVVVPQGVCGLGRRVRAAR